MSFRKTLFVLMVAPSISFAQQAVQQPVVGVTSLNTTVLVPDRGTMYLGGVSSGQFGRNQYGPLRSGTSSGYSLQSTSVSTSVYIHDLQAMDEAILNSVKRGDSNHSAAMTTMPNRADQAASDLSPAEKMAKFERLARKADQDGRAGLAKLHWQMAAKYGSKTAEKRLAELTTPVQAAKAEKSAR